MRLRIGVVSGLAAGAVALFGCGDGGDASSSGSVSARSGARPVLCAPLRARITGRISSPAATELSGLAISRLQRGVLWTHNDSGDSARVLAVTTRGRLLAELAVPNAENLDWEDIAVGPGSSRRRDALYLADIGDNLKQRAEVVVYRVQEPRVAESPGTATTRARPLALRYPDGAHDAEALLVSPTGALLIVTKDFSGVAGVYLAARPRVDRATTLRRVARLSLGSAEAVTAGSVSADGRTIALRSYFRAFLWQRRRGESVAAALKRRPCRADADLFAEGQGEALALSRDGRAFFTVPEGAQPAIRRYSRARPE